jgi:hypothetical protein
MIARGEVKAAMRIVAFGWWWAERALHRSGEKSGEMAGRHKSEQG